MWVDNLLIHLVICCIAWGSFPTNHGTTTGQGGWTFLF